MPVYRWIESDIHEEIKELVPKITRITSGGIRAEGDDAEPTFKEGIEIETEKDTTITPAQLATLDALFPDKKREGE
jgi:hypothetical protein